MRISYAHGYDNRRRIMKQVLLPSGEAVPALGVGTWRMGETKSARAAEVAALKLGIDLGMSLIDTAEMYGEGGAEQVVAEAVAGQRDRVFIVSKIYPHNASRKGAIAACERSLKRLATDRIDLYLLHWRGSIPLAETVAAFETLRQSGKIRYWGVSNFDIHDMQELSTLEAGKETAANQVLYNLIHRGIEWDLLPWCRERAIPIMAYSPIEQGKLARDKTLMRIAARYRVSASSVALAWLLRHDDVIVIPKAVTAEHMRENLAALTLRLSAEDQSELDQAFPPPRKAMPLAMN